MEQTFNDFLSTSTSSIPRIGFIINIILSAILSTCLSWIYIKYGQSLSNRRQFSKNFLLLSMTTMLIITIVKSSLALSLGLVGALSIIRFRSAIKEPEELAFLFIAIAIGLGLGANQTSITIIGFVLISSIIIIANTSTNKYNNNQNLFLTIENSEDKNINTKDIIKLLEKYCTAVDLKRLNESSMNFEILFMIEINKFHNLNELKEELLKLKKNMKITFLDNKGLS